MTIDDFLDFSAREFQLERSLVHGEINFRDIGVWNSLNALIYISNIHDKFGVLISSKDLSKIETLKEIFDIIKERG